MSLIGSHGYLISSIFQVLMVLMVLIGKQHNKLFPFDGPRCLMFRNISWHEQSTYDIMDRILKDYMQSLCPFHTLHFDFFQIWV